MSKCHYYVTYWLNIHSTATTNWTDCLPMFQKELSQWTVPLQRPLYGHHVASNHQQFGCLFNSIFRLTTKKPSRLYFTDTLSWKSISKWWIYRTRASNANVFPCQDVFMIIRASSLAGSTFWNITWKRCYLLKPATGIISSEEWRN